MAGGWLLLKILTVLWVKQLGKASHLPKRDPISSRSQFAEWGKCKLKLSNDEVTASAMSVVLAIDHEHSVFNHILTKLHGSVLLLLG